MQLRETSLEDKKFKEEEHDDLHSTVHKIIGFLNEKLVTDNNYYSDQDQSIILEIINILQKIDANNNNEDNENPFEQIQEITQDNSKVIELFKMACNAGLKDTSYATDVKENLEKETTENKNTPRYVPPSKSLTRKQIEWIDLGKKSKFAFRNDTRGYKTIFEQGFKPRYLGDKIIDSPFISCQENIVACSSRLRSTILFPYNDNEKVSYLYIFKLSKFFDVHGHGIKSHVENKTLDVNQMSRVNLDESDLSCLFADELIAEEIPREDIIGAIEIRRGPYDPAIHPIPDYMKTPHDQLTDDDKDHISFLQKIGRYSMGEFHLNEHCTLPKSDINLIIDFVNKEKAANCQKEDARTVPMPTTGYKRNSFFDPKQIDPEETQVTQSTKKSALCSKFSLFAISTAVVACSAYFLPLNFK